MAPKPTRNSRVPTTAVPGAHATDHSSGHEQPKRRYPKPGRIVSASTGGTTPPTKQDEGTTSARSSSSDDDEEAGVDGTSSTKPDDEDTEDTDGDALAPSDPAVEGHGDQAGHIIVNDANDDEGDSDDEAYNGIDLISDSEEEDSDLMQEEEERNIIESEGDDLQSMPAATVPTSPTEASDEWAGFDLEHGFFSTDISHFDEQYGRSDHSMFESEYEMRRATGVFDDFNPVPLASRSPSPPLQPLRRVRFKDPVSYHTDGSDIVSDDGGLYGLFNSASAQIGEADLSGGQGVDDDDEGSSVGNSSGYETDYGDTTDEEDVPASATTRPQSLLRRPSLSSMDNEAQITSPVAPSPFKVPATPLRHRRGPRMGSWTVDRTKPFAMIDSTGDNMVIVPAKRPARAGDFSISSTAITSPTTSQPWLASAIDENGIDYSNFSFHDDPMLASEPDVMPSTLPLTAPSSRIQDQTFASSSDFLPMDAIGNVNAVYAVDDQDDDGDDEGMLNVKDFIDFGVSSDDEGDGDQGLLENASLLSPASTSTLGTGAKPQYKTPSSGRNSAQHLLKHLDKGAISAFRRGQPHHQAQLRRPQSGSSLNSQAFKGGRHAAAHTSLSSQKKRKLNDTFGGRPSFGVGTKKRLLNRR
ncbi:hypothetical protein N7G274_003517 [Stereocaulon virgatum]|uniref:Uncharacterized protein n=1 Tax=Stereocaulon virgatum TaxID=373712 RepID=A0ABR4AGN7_9LECA